MVRRDKTGSDGRSENLDLLKAKSGRRVVPEHALMALLKRNIDTAKNAIAYTYDLDHIPAHER